MDDDNCPHGFTYDACDYDSCREIFALRAEVELAEPGTTDALKRAREAWDILVTCRASVDSPPEMKALMEAAMYTLTKVLGRVTDTAAGEDGNA